jgi:putative peptidoglycan lipid II flippase
MFNVATILCAIVLVPVMPGVGQPAIAAIAIGTVLGGLAQWAVQWPLLRREGFRFTPQLDWNDPALRRVLLLMGPGTLGLAATQVNVFVNTLLATGEGTGAVSWLNYAFRLMYLPIGLFGVSIATATTPAIARQAASAERGAVRQTIADGLILMLMLNVPATIGLAVLATPIVQLMYERGAFTPRETLATAAALQYYAVGLLGYSVVRIASPAFYALDRNRAPVVVSAITVAANVVLNVILVRTMGYTGLALGTSIAALINAGLLLVLLRRHLEGIEDARIADSLGRIAVASIAMGLAAVWLYGQMSELVPGNALLPQIVRLAVAIAGAVAVLAFAAYLLSIKEFQQGVDLVLRRFRRLKR